MRVFDYDKLKDPQYFCDGRIAAHSDHKYFASHADVELGVEEYKESLNGVWKFHYARNYRSAVPGFEKEDYCCCNADQKRGDVRIIIQSRDRKTHIDE